MVPGMRLPAVLLSLFLFFPSTAFSEFSPPDIRLDTDPLNNMSQYPRLASDGQGNVYAVWVDDRGGNNIYFNRSSDDGATWLPSDITLNDTAGAPQNGKIQISTDGDGYVTVFFIKGGGMVNMSSDDHGQTWVTHALNIGGPPHESNSVLNYNFDSNGQGGICAVWDSGGLDDEIYINCSADYGQTWFSAYKQVNSNVPYPYDIHRDPSVCVDTANRVYVSWQDNRGSTGVEKFVFFNVSNDLGQTWPADKGLTGGFGSVSFRPKTACDNDGHVVVAYESGTLIRSVYSTDAGQSFTAPSVIYATQNGQNARLHADDAGRFHLFWGDNTDAFQELKYRRSLDFGETWSQPLKISNTNDAQGDAFQVAQFADRLAVVWENNEPWEGIYVNMSHNGGALWQSANFQADHTPTGTEETARPTLSLQDGGITFVAWEDGRNGDHDIYFNRGDFVNDGDYQREADYIVDCQYDNTTSPAHGAINNVLGDPTWVVPRENALAILGLQIASEKLNDSSYLQKAQLAADYLVSIQDPSDGAWFDQYSFTAPSVLSKSPTQTAEVMMAFYKLGFDPARYDAMKKGAGFLLSLQDVANKTGQDDGLISGGKDTAGNFQTWRWASDNSFAYWALKGAERWAVLNSDISFAETLNRAAEDILEGINNHLFITATWHPDTRTWFKAIDAAGVPQDTSLKEWINYAPQMLDVPAEGVGSTDVGNWIRTNLQDASDGAVRTNNPTLFDRKSPGFSFQAALSWFDLGQLQYANDAVQWAVGSGLWHVDGGWIDWIEPTQTAPEWQRFIDTSFYAMASFNGGYDFSTSTDADGDGVVDAADNCVHVANGNAQPGAQLDTDGDGIGNACDCDIHAQDQFCGLWDGIIVYVCGNPGLYPGAVGHPLCAHADMTGDGIVNQSDFDRYQAEQPRPGMSAVNGNRIPVATFVVSGQNGLTISFDGSASFDPDGTLGWPVFAWNGVNSIVTHVWNFDDPGKNFGLHQFNPAPTVTFSQPGTYDVSLTVWDNTGARSDVFTIPVTVY